MICLHLSPVLACFHASNGALHVVVWCYGCSTNVTTNITPNKAFLPKKGITLDELPQVSHNEPKRECYLCHAIAPCEDHHLAEQAVYGELADLFPTFPLCVPCHKEITIRFMRAWRVRPQMVEES